ncbi:hypothetical protein EVAR_47224_1 [Eumeta japonica]|uniref:Uncharacterized protein n=1 Tax=Eumeta variegata TaxID=151549 RepID=A0A4C1XTV7_EUMVA|nr:hypothetical protein EVAR_47224_1 [Eumeta japonica]
MFNGHIIPERVIAEEESSWVAREATSPPPLQCLKIKALQSVRLASNDLRWRNVASHKKTGPQVQSLSASYGANYARNFSGG